LAAAFQVHQIIKSTTNSFCLFLPEQIPRLLLDFKRVSKVHLLLLLLLLDQRSNSLLISFVSWLL